ncbi:MAG: hypothetical protein H6Q82_3052 [Deltaproteobacteria bacterium]|nr:hypothetical protein [Deltaproteobacteria bacterium]
MMSLTMGRDTRLTDMTIPLKDPNRKKRRLPLFIAAGLLIAAVFISLFRDMGVVDNWRLRKTERQLRSEVEKLRQENALLKRTVEDLRGNPAVIEQEARRLGPVRTVHSVSVISRHQPPMDLFGEGYGRRKFQ